MADLNRRMLVFEDLRNQQFKSVDRTYGLDTEHMKLTLQNLAKWHAGTANFYSAKEDYFILKLFSAFIFYFLEY